MQNNKLIRLSSKNSSWSDFCMDWADQCVTFGEEFDQYAQASIPVLRQLAEEDSRDAGVFALQCEENKFHAVCQANSTFLPGYNGKVLRIRHLVMSPYYDFGDGIIDEYVAALGAMFAKTVGLCWGELPSSHVKFHLRSPADRRFFAEIGDTLEQSEDLFSSVKMRGAWLYLTLASEL